MKQQDFMLAAWLTIIGVASMWIVIKFGNCNDLGVTVAQCLASQ